MKNSTSKSLLNKLVPREESCFIQFTFDIEKIALPERFTFPFYYEPHPLCIVAAEELQSYLQNQTEWVHNFGIVEGREGMAIGKMFGVLVVQNRVGDIGYLTAFSGKLADKNSHKRFVPPIYDMLKEDSYFLKSIVEINEINAKVEAFEKNGEYLESIELFKKGKAEGKRIIANAQEQKILDKAERKRKRIEGEKALTNEKYSALLDLLGKESVASKVQFRKLQETWKEKLDEFEAAAMIYENELESYKQKRKELSANLQQWIFDQYHFLNHDKEVKSLCDIFATTTAKFPTAGSGECAAPKLLQYAFQHDMKPIAMAEFWWGEALSEVRIHGQYYPACRGKCEPILSHMLKGIELDPNPMLENGGLGKKITIVYEDDHLAIINKPPELLSVPGKNVIDSVFERMKARYPDATGSLVVHRLDMSTSGLMIIPKTQEVFKYIQRQFIRRKIKKRYVALLDGELVDQNGTIDLPLRLDIDDRPRQLVCYEHGKSAKTDWEVVESSKGTTRVFFYPMTGRTHQLRVHSAHPLGLSMPIIGDDLYGKKQDRLMLHAESITFRHPENREDVTFYVAPEF